MREIKFRGRISETNEWVYGCYWTNGLDNHFIREYLENKQFVLKDYEVEPKTVGQYTGLNDKNGKEIWEGDILLHVGSGECSEHSNPYGGPHRSFKGERVYVLNLPCGFIARHISSFGDWGEKIPNCCVKGWSIIKNYDLWNLQRWYEVIGNIYEGEAK